ncbi:MAG: peptidylprolyl isomerase [Bryobacteraceae bacterium]
MTSRFKLLTPIVSSVLLLAACSSSTEPQKSAEAERQPPAASEPAATPPPVVEPPQEKAANTFKVRFDTSKGPIVVEVHRDWAPIGAEQFHQLVSSGYFNGARFFRVVPNFVIQFGLAANPATTKKWDRMIEDDPVLQTNRVGSLSFATRGPNTRTAQIFINLRSNQNLDGQGFAPFAIVLEGMEVVEQIHSGYGEAPDQEAITKSGNAYLTKNFPDLDYIRTATIQ